MSISPGEFEMYKKIRLFCKCKYQLTQATTIMVGVKPIRFLCHSLYVSFEAGAGVNIIVAVFKFIQFPRNSANEQNKRGLLCNATVV